MRLEEAIDLANRMASDCESTLGEYGWSRAVAADPNAHYWALIFAMVDAPPGWFWVFNLNDLGEDQIMIAHKATR